MNQRATLSLSELFDSAYDGIFVLDAERRVVLFNQACERLTGRSAGEVIGTACECGNGGNCAEPNNGSLAATLCPGAEIFQGHLNPATRRIHLRSGNGEPRWLETHYMPVRDAGGRPQCVIGVLRDGAAEPAEEAVPVTPLDERLADIERRAILAAIRKAGGRRNLAARMMGISRSRLYRRLEALGINPDGEASGKTPATAAAQLSPSPGELHASS
jgi:hypothetical protein